MDLPEQEPYRESESLDDIDEEEDEFAETGSQGRSPVFYVVLAVVLLLVVFALFLLLASLGGGGGEPTQVAEQVTATEDAGGDMTEEPENVEIQEATEEVTAEPIPTDVSGAIISTVTASPSAEEATEESTEEATSTATATATPEEPASTTAEPTAEDEATAEATPDLAGDLIAYFQEEGFDVPEGGVVVVDTSLGSTLTVSNCAVPSPAAGNAIVGILDLVAAGLDTLDMQQFDAEVDSVAVQIVSNCEQEGASSRLIGLALADIEAYAAEEIDAVELQRRLRPIN